MFAKATACGYKSSRCTTRMLRSPCCNGDSLGPQLRKQGHRNGWRESTVFRQPLLLSFLSIGPAADSQRPFSPGKNQIHKVATGVPRFKLSVLVFCGLVVVMCAFVRLIGAVARCRFLRGNVFKSASLSAIPDQKAVVPDGLRSGGETDQRRGLRCPA